MPTHRLPHTDAHALNAWARIAPLTRFTSSTLSLPPMEEGRVRASMAWRRDAWAAWVGAAGYRRERLLLQLSPQQGFIVRWMNGWMDDDAAVGPQLQRGHRPGSAGGTGGRAGAQPHGTRPTRGL